ncbi:glycerophosphodiester phosphodiesterase [Paenibacillus cremeus]|uniref:Glycerophosphodiester phosphodiesterase n=1 Tax=Paenibacillus cremeus TaxID=2163881 RepID=A0A559JVL1_9BACL|nr:glycerophosphodiester phosphodiesterase [Paenibacillus cremeus]TVY03922.1 glycerophosphodiester phosphodiesterase [Paenibacillus cremeus]
MTLPFITAHTGCMNTPDNSVESLELGLRSGADIVEVDIGATKDGVAVLLHDSEVHLASRGVCKLSELTFEELQSDEIIDKHDGRKSRIVSLAEILPIVKASGKRVNLDLKSDACIEPMAKLVLAENMLDQAFLSGTEAARAAYIQKHHPEIRKVLNANSALFKETDYMSAVKQTIEEALAASCIGININYKLCRAELVEAAQSVQLPVYVWTVNDEEEIKRMIGLGVRSITTRDVPAVIRAFQSY